MDRELRETAIRFQPLREWVEFERFIAEFTNYERMKEYRYDGDFFLGRMESLARDLGNPHEAYRSIHIAGTKGKGATSLMLESLLAASGYVVGTYTSPHVEHLRERIRFDGTSITEAELCALTNSILRPLEARWLEGPSRFPTFFELMTALAMLHFLARRVEWAVFEVGLGGRLDATNILHPRWTAITSIGLEHTDKLGGTLELIAREKAGIVKPRTPVVLGALPAEAEAAILGIAAEREARVIPAPPGMVRLAGPGTLEVGGLFFPPVSLPSGAVRGPALRADLALALTLWEGALAEDGREPEAGPLREAMGRLRLPARVEVFPGDPPVVVDGAHTPESVEALRLALEEIGFPRPRGLVFALASDKPLKPILKELGGLAETAVFTCADPARGRDPEELAREYSEMLGRPALVIEDPVEALDRVSGSGRAVVVTGSFYLAGKLRPLVS